MIDVAKTRAYYERLTTGDLCQCAYCRNYCNEIKSAYPLVADFLSAVGVDIEKPFETMPLEPDEMGNILYAGVQYIVFGTDAGFAESTIGDVSVGIASSHPSTDITDPHFVIEIEPIKLRWTVDTDGE